jgi:hypothetical protein
VHIFCLLLIGFCQGNLFPTDHAVKVQSVHIGECDMSINVPKNAVNWNGCSSCGLCRMGNY